MLKKVLVAVMGMALIAPNIVMAEGGNHPMTGCGLGYVLFGHGDNSRIVQVFAGTTNNISGNQTFGVTSGTSGCTEDGAVKFVKEVEVFADVNLDSLRREMASGQGEFARAFASLLGANEQQIPAYMSLFKSNYDVLFPTADTTSGEMLLSLQTLLASKKV